MSDKKRSITKAEDVARLALQTDIQALIDLGTDARPWTGTRPIINPSTGEEVGSRNTFNINLSLEDAMFARASKALELLANTGAYVEANFGGLKLIATKCYLQERSGENVNVMQFSLPNQPSVMKTNDDKFLAKIREMVELVSSDAVKSELKHTAPVGKDGLPF